MAAYLLMADMKKCVFFPGESIDSLALKVVEWIRAKGPVREIEEADTETGDVITYYSLKVLPEIIILESLVGYDLDPKWPPIRTAVASAQGGWRLLRSGHRLV